MGETLRQALWMCSWRRQLPVAASPAFVIAALLLVLLPVPAQAQFDWTKVFGDGGSSGSSGTGFATLSPSFVGTLDESREKDWSWRGRATVSPTIGAETHACTHKAGS